ncbi:hypothetical protein LTR53_008553 [Teratosphaeriaceae sp. CCFEE 6253]|nr:hypothetical protein LTR53_008553 [Teratosphaeriaceae sp. CCFEE 6253]
MYAIVATAAFMASSAYAASVGTAHVINKCTYPVTLCNVPAADGGYSEIDQTLEPNGSYSQQWTELTNGNGWSIKLSPDTTLDNIMQYEYTFHNDGTIWYDLSDVNGNPWDSNWEITAASPGGTCSPKQQAYRYATDDAYGMQACPQDSEITVTLCSGESQDDGGAASASSSVAALTSTEAVATSTSAPAETTTSAAESSSVETSTTPVAETTTTSAASVASTTPASSSATSYNWHTWHQKNVAATTLATSTVAVASTTTAPAGNVVVEVETQVVTEIVTATAYAKRHAHHPHKAAA